MEILYLLIPIGLVILALAIKLLFWAINSGQYDDLDTEAQRILFEDDTVKPKNNKTTTLSSKIDLEKQTAGQNKLD